MHPINFDGIENGGGEAFCMSHFLGYICLSGLSSSPFVDHSTSSKSKSTSFVVTSQDTRESSKKDIPGILLLYTLITCHNY